MTDEYLTLAELAKYAKVSPRLIRRWLALPPGTALPCYRPGRRVVVRRSEFDAWFQQYRSRGSRALTATLRELGIDPALETRQPTAPRTRRESKAS
jgi:excisionase family DNA binding protein